MNTINNKIYHENYYSNSLNDNNKQLVYSFLGSFKKLNDSVKNKIKNKESISTISNKTKNWLSDQPRYTLHRSIVKPIVRNFKRNHYYIFEPNYLWEIDLCDLSMLSSQNENNRYILTVIDVFQNLHTQIAMQLYCKQMPKTKHVPIRIRTPRDASS